MFKNYKIKQFCVNLLFYLKFDPFKFRESEAHEDNTSINNSLLLFKHQNVKKLNLNQLL